MRKTGTKYSHRIMELVGMAPVRIINCDAMDWVRSLVMQWAREHQSKLLGNWTGGHHITHHTSSLCNHFINN